jgi:hypothetical protein
MTCSRCVDDEISTYRDTHLFGKFDLPRTMRGWPSLGSQLFTDAQKVMAHQIMCPVSPPLEFYYKFQTG